MPSINQRIVDHDLLAQNDLPVLHYSQIRPPALRSAVGVIFLAGTVTADGKRRGCA